MINKNIKKKKIVYSYLTVLLIFMLILSGCDDKEDDKPESVGIIVENITNTTGVLVEGIGQQGDLSISSDAGDAETVAEDMDNQSDSIDTSADIEEADDEKLEEDAKSDDNELGDADAIDEANEDDSRENEEADENSLEDADSDAGAMTESASVTPGQVIEIPFDTSWTYSDYSMIHSGSSVLYTASSNRKNVVIGVNAGHGTKGGTSVKTYCHPDMTPKVTGGSTQAGAIKAIAVSGGMSFFDGTAESAVTLRMAQILKDTLLARGYDVLMIRDGSDVQLDNVARTIMANNKADCHIALHWDGDNLDYDKGCFYISTPDGIKGMDPVSYTWQKSEALGQALINGLKNNGCKINGKGSMAIDLTQTSYSTVPSVDVELGNAASIHDDVTLQVLANGLADGVAAYFN